MINTTHCSWGYIVTNSLSTDQLLNNDWAHQRNVAMSNLCETTRKTALCSADWWVAPESLCPCALLGSSSREQPATLPGLSSAQSLVHWTSSLPIPTRYLTLLRMVSDIIKKKENLCSEYWKEVNCHEYFDHGISISNCILFYLTACHSILFYSVYKLRLVITDFLAWGLEII